MEEKSLAREMLEDYKKANKRQFIIIIVILAMWFITIGYLVYLLRTYDYVDETTQEISDIESIENSDIVNGDYYGEN